LLVVKLDLCKKQLELVFDSPAQQPWQLAQEKGQLKATFHFHPKQLMPLLRHRRRTVVQVTPQIMK